MTLLLRSHFKDEILPNQLRTALENSGIWDFLLSTARSYVELNRNKELTLFNELYLSGLPRDCFINYYDVGVSSGLSAHRDHVSFCTIVLCLCGNGEGNLVLTQETTLPITINLSSNDVITFARIEHYVDIVCRSAQRVTLNAFF